MDTSQQTTQPPSTVQGTSQPTNQQPVDQQALALTHAIALQESGTGGKPNYNAIGDNGTSKGAYQWQPGNFEAAAKSAGLDPTDFSPENQDKVAYSEVKGYKDKGYDPGQIASLWNSGSPNNWQNHSGTTTINGKQISYDTPAYVKGVQKYYQQITGGSDQSQVHSYNPKPYSNPNANSASPGVVDTSGTTSQDQSQPTTDNSTLGGEIAGRVNDASSAIGEVGNGVSDVLSGNLSGVLKIGSGALQTAGAVAGGLGDVVNKGLELIPGVKALEGVVGSGVGQLAQTQSGQAIVKSLKDFATAHPELTKDAGAAFNIVTALPILDGLGAVKDVALDGVSSALKGVAEKTATKDLTATAARTIGGRSALADAPDAIKTLIDERALPDIEGNKYATKEAYDKLSNNISSIEDKELQPALKSVSTSGVDTRQPIENLRQQALSNIQQEFKSGGNVGKAESEVNRVFDDYKKSYGDYVTLEDVNDMKRGIRKTVNFNSPKLDSDVSYHLGQVFQNSIEDGAQKLGLPDIGAINQKMARLIKGQNMLKYIEGKPVKTGLFGGFIKDAATGVGEMAGNASGIPLAGAYVGREVGGKVGGKLANITEGILNRTGKDATRQTLGSTLSRGKGLIKGALAQKAVKQN